MSIPFNIPFISGKELEYIGLCLENKKFSGDGIYTKKVQKLLETKFNYQKVLLTTSCTDAIEMASHLFEINQGDEVIMPSYTFVSTANPFVLRGAKVVFADNYPDSPNISFSEIKRLTTSKTKAIVLVHYGAIPTRELEEIIAFAKENNIYVLEDAAQCIDAQFSKDKFLGSYGDIGVLSFHDTKNINCGEGGCIVINNPQLNERSHIIWEKGTNRQAFIQGQVSKYEWVDIGSSFLMSELNAAFLLAQLENIDIVTNKRKAIYQAYYSQLKSGAENNFFSLWNADGDTLNGHNFYIVLKSLEERIELQHYLKSQGIQTAFHYQSLHRSQYFKSKYQGKDLPNADHLTDCLLRLPLFFDLSLKEVEFISQNILSFWRNK